MWRRLRRFVADDRAQDLVEYGLLVAFLALAGVVGVNALRTSLCVAYVTWNESGQGCSTMPAPGSTNGGCSGPDLDKLQAAKNSCP